MREQVRYKNIMEMWEDRMIPPSFYFISLFTGTSFGAQGGQWGEEGRVNKQARGPSPVAPRSLGTSGHYIYLAYQILLPVTL